MIGPSQTVTPIVACIVLTLKEQQLHSLGYYMTAHLNKINTYETYLKTGRVYVHRVLFSRRAFLFPQLNKQDQLTELRD